MDTHAAFPEASVFKIKLSAAPLENFKDPLAVKLPPVEMLVPMVVTAKTVEALSAHQTAKKIISNDLKAFIVHFVTLFPTRRHSSLLG